MKKQKYPVCKKKNDDMIKNNYRPLSILSVFSTILETIVVDQPMQYFKCMFNDMLCAYRNMYGCQHVLIN